VNTDGTALYIDSTVPTFTVGPTAGLTGTAEEGSVSGNYYVKGASVSFTASDEGIGGMKFAVTLTGSAPTVDDTDGIGGWANYDGTAKTVNLEGFGAEANIQTVYVHVKDAVGNTKTSSQVVVYTNALYIDKTPPSEGTVTSELSTAVNNNSYYTVTNAKIKFTPTDGTGVGGMKFGVTLTNDAPTGNDDTDGIGGWATYDGNEETVDLAGFGAVDIQTVYVHVKDALGNTKTSDAVTVHSGPLYIDRTPPIVGGTLTIDPSTGEITGITISDGTGNVAGFEYAPGNYDLKSDVSNAVPLTLTNAGSTYSITGGMPEPLPAAGDTQPSVEYTITLTVYDKGGVGKAYPIGVTVTARAGADSGPDEYEYKFTDDSAAWNEEGEVIGLSSMMAPVGFASPFSSPTGTNTPVAGTASIRSPAPVYGSTGRVRYPLAGVTRTPARSAGTTPRQSAVPASYAYSGENAEYLHIMRPYPGNAGSSAAPVPVTVIRSEPVSLKTERPGRIRTSPQDSGPAESSYTEAPPTEEPEFEDYGPSLSAAAASLPANSPVPADSPPDNHQVPFRNSHFNPCILPSGSGSGSRKSRGGTEEE
jgi:hypothetical protein